MAFDSMAFDSMAFDSMTFDSMTVATGGTPFQRQVWKSLCKISSDLAMTYGELAKAINNISDLRNKAFY